jgi:hypothetical protein
VDVADLDATLAEAFDAGAGERRAVARMACDLAATDRYAAVTDTELTTDIVVRNLRDAPDEGLASRWNWWLGSLELAFGRPGDTESGTQPPGGFAEFQVRQFEAEDG